VHDHPQLLVVAGGDEAAQGGLYRRRVEQPRVQLAAVQPQLAAGAVDDGVVMATASARLSMALAAPSRRRICWWPMPASSNTSPSGRKPWRA
jgi:hypothetical protein